MESDAIIGIIIMVAIVAIATAVSLRNKDD
jgi:hypothetical protein